jgi:hypothetical protein
MIKAIADFGRSICDELPFILAHFRTSQKWRLEEFMGKTPRSMVDVENNHDQYPDLVVAAKAFYDSRLALANKGGRRTFGEGDAQEEDQDFVHFAKHNPDRWMLHDFLRFSESLSLEFAHELLVEFPAKYDVGPDDHRDAAIYERVGVLAASVCLGKLDIVQIPALVDYTIHEYDGLENVSF